MFRSVGRGGVAAVIAVVACAGPAPVAAAKRAVVHGGTVTVRVEFRRMPGTWFWKSDRYVLARTVTAGGAGNRGVLIDDRTGRRRQVVFPAGCAPEALGAGAVALGCVAGDTQTQQMYDIATGETHPFVPSPSLAQPPLGDACGGPLADGATTGATVVAIGTRWVALDTGSFDPHSAEQFAIQNRQTGHARCVPMSPHMTVALNAANPTSKVCAPLTVPVLSRPGSGQGIGSLTALGDGFELSAGASSYLERCGTHLHEFLTTNGYQRSAAFGRQCPAVACTLPANRHVIVWPGRGTVHGMWLPSRRRFTIEVGASVDPSHGADAQYEVALTGRHLYLSTVAHLWQAPIPAPPTR